ncbi:3-hydroxyacyl-CoA dehydrogenase [Geopsychrobacter electrodiphilus]|uniref:3-hydroxyacyl-CoA dehydrogenase n=1 Tax=Geopsychrobacter electrodiphilus TaxID=225196 RepID=UPI00035C8D77|nr:3-hydroxyacyl-CoA dehydrogenase [Geopsychrobacter electrodiphilus]
MTLDCTRTDLTLGIVGTGLMGQGIAQIAAQAGVKVLLYDTRENGAEQARTAIQKVLNRLVEKGKISDLAATESLNKLHVLGCMEELSPCHLVVEAIFENLEVKHQLMLTLEDIVSDNCLLATNTSSLSVTSIAAGCRLPGRIGGFHFFSPVPLMKIVEVIKGIMTEDWVSLALTKLAMRIGHTPVQAKDTPGFIVNHAGRGFGTEALRILDEGITEFSKIDKILCEAAGFRMGPFQLLDLVGLDVSHPVIESIYNQYYQEPRFRPSTVTRQRLAAGLLGRKSGKGFYCYEENTPEAVKNFVPTARPAKVWISNSIQEMNRIVTELVVSLGAVLDTDDIPSKESLCIVTPLGKDATTATLEENLDASRTLALDTLFSLKKHRTLMTTPLTSQAMRDAAHGLFASDGTAVTVINDSAGFVAQRVVALIVNISCDIAQQQIASPGDIDLAVTLGLGYPQGPLSWGDTLGPLRILTILNEMSTFYGDPRYRPSPWLKRRANLGVSLLTVENQEKE